MKREEDEGGESVSINICPCVDMLINNHHHHESHGNHFNFSVY